MEGGKWSWLVFNYHPDIKLGPQENQVKPQSGWPTFRPRFEDYFRKIPQSLMDNHVTSTDEKKSENKTIYVSIYTVYLPTLSNVMNEKLEIL